MEQGVGSVELRLGVKIYDNDWFLRHQLTPEQVADLLEAWGVTYVIAQSKYLPMANSAVTSAVTQRDRDLYAALDDRALRDALHRRGIAYFACLNICFDPAFTASHPSLKPVDQFGNVAEQLDWYIGLPPDRQENLAHKIDLLQKGVAALAPDVVHLGFIRWPGFWETWLPGDSRSDKPEYCFSPATVRRFCAATGVDVATDSPQQSAGIIGERYRSQWTAWKCGATVAAIAQIRAALEPIQTGLKYAINTLPLFRTDFDNAVEEVFGQDIAMLADVVDIFEVMAYHQIMAQPASWPARVADDIRRRSGRAAVCTLQAAPLYLTGMHQGRGRSPELTADEFSSALDHLAATSVDGACVFTFTDLIDMRGTAHGEAMIGALKRFRC
ncbi:MAG: hypothetical protein P4L82_21340 [Ancalomicrobiaceae bacterium]|nr:hypothetical protein [Ancalomicrobiaceae bacterium]